MRLLLIEDDALIGEGVRAGLKLVEQHKFLPYQYFLIFGR